MTQNTGDALIKRSLQSLIDMQENPSVLIDRDYRIVAANRAYHTAYGVETAQVVGRHCYEVSHHRDSPCHFHNEDCPHRQVFETGQAHQVLHTHFDYQGHPEHVCIKGHPVLGPDGQLYLGESILRLTSAEDIDCDEMRIIGRSPALLRAIEQLSRAATSNASVLLLGESGVGKELAAHYVHHHGLRKGKPFLAVDCAALPETLFESEVFGHERGAFTGCVGRKQGLFELAHEGTLFLDEVGEIPVAMQAKLLRVLETGEFRRVGGRDILHADVRIVAATNRELRQRVSEGSFREDLYYRLSCITIQLPPLRERRSDIPVLAEALLVRINHANGTRCYLTGEAMERLTNHDFPGNVRELRNILQRAVAMCSNGAIGLQDLGIETEAVADTPRRASLPAQRDSGPLLSMRTLEAQHIIGLMKHFNGNRRQVAHALGISERTLYRKLERYGLR